MMLSLIIIAENQQCYDPVQNINWNKSCQRDHSTQRLLRINQMFRSRMWPSSPRSKPIWLNCLLKRWTPPTDGSIGLQSKYHTRINMYIRNMCRNSGVTSWNPRIIQDLLRPTRIRTSFQCNGNNNVILLYRVQWRGLRSGQVLSTTTLCVFVVVKKVRELTGRSDPPIATDRSTSDEAHRHRV